MNVESKVKNSLRILDIKQKITIGRVFNLDGKMKMWLEIGFNFPVLANQEEVLVRVKS